MRSRCQSSSSASVVFVCFRVSRPPSLVRLWLTYPPSVLGLPPDLRVFSRWLPGRSFQTTGCSSLALRRHPSVSSLSSPLMTPGLSSTRKPGSQAPRWNFATLQHFRTQKPFFSLLAKRPKDLALSLESPTRRVWLPSRWCQLLEPLAASFSSQRSWASPFEAFLPYLDRNTVSGISSALALPYQTSSA
jgi:hypothetical protein